MKLWQLLCLLSCSCLAICRPSRLDDKFPQLAGEHRKHGRISVAVPPASSNPWLVELLKHHQAAAQSSKVHDVRWKNPHGEKGMPHGSIAAVVKRAVKSSSSNDTNGKNIYEQPWFDGVIAGVGFIVIMTVIIVIAIGIACCCYFHCKRRMRMDTDDAIKEIDLENSSDWSFNQESLQYHRVQRAKRPLGESDDDAAIQFFLNMNYQLYKFDEKLDDLGSRVQKSWYSARSVKDDDFVVLTVAPVSGSCPLQLHKYQKGLNKLLGAVKVHPFIHPVEMVDYLVDHKCLVVVQPRRFQGSLKDLIYKVSHPSLDWSQKYSRRSQGLPPAKVAQYGRHVLEAVTFLYSKHFPMLGHIQSGNIFVVDDVCQLGGYESTLVGYKTRLFMKCRDHLQQFDSILFGHLIFEMSAGYELTELRPGGGEYRIVQKAVRPILEYIFEEGFPHSISDIRDQAFFSVALPELSDFNPAAVQMSDSMNEVLKKVRKNKPRVQKMPKRPSGGRGAEGEGQVSTSWKDRLPSLPKQLFGNKKRDKKVEKLPGAVGLSPEVREPLLAKGESS